MQGRRCLLRARLRIDEHVLILFTISGQSTTRHRFMMVFQNMPSVLLTVGIALLSSLFPLIRCADTREPDRESLIGAIIALVVMIVITIFLFVFRCCVTCCRRRTRAKSLGKSALRQPRSDDDVRKTRSVGSAVMNVGVNGWFGDDRQ